MIEKQKGHLDSLLTDNGIKQVQLLADGLNTPWKSLNVGLRKIKFIVLTNKKLERRYFYNSVLICTWMWSIFSSGSEKWKREILLISISRLRELMTMKSTRNSGNKLVRLRLNV